MSEGEIGEVIDPRVNVLAYWIETGEITQWYMNVWPEMLDAQLKSGQSCIEASPDDFLNLSDYVVQDGMIVLRPEGE